MMTSLNENISALLAICAGNSPVTGELPAQRPVTRSFDVFFDLSLNKQFSKQSWCWWFETSSCPLWRHCNVFNPWSAHIFGMGGCLLIISHSSLSTVPLDWRQWPFNWQTFRRIVITDMSANTVQGLYSVIDKTFYQQISHCEMYGEIRYQFPTSTVQALAYGNGHVVSSNTLLGVR